jgi:glycine oxidase
VANSFDVAIIGGGIVGVSAAAFLAEQGVSVCLFERDEIAAAASGRNSGAIQHPFDPVLADLHRDTLAIYRELAAVDYGTDFQLAREPAGLLLISHDEDAVAAAAESIRGHSPDLTPTLLDAAELHALEPALAPGLTACHTATGYPVAPAVATKTFAARARAAGATVVIGGPAQVVVEGGHATGVRLTSGETVDARQVLVAAGPWTPSLVPGWSGDPPITPLWGVVVSVVLAQAPHAGLEELGIDQPGAKAEELFSLFTAGSVSSVGSTFLANKPDPDERVASILERGARFVPALADAQAVSVRACARPLSVDGRPFIGSIPPIRGLFVCAGHGPWGISTGPASARLVVDEMLGHGAPPPELSAARVA